jgi:CO dehydrogenase/acetyl-CoA synthase alpha subunit
MIRWLLHLAGVICFLVAVIFGAVTIQGEVIEVLDWVSLGLAAWCASSLGPPPIPSRGS